VTLARTLGVALSGVNGQIVEIESDLSAGLPGMSFTGMSASYS
jgi:magnesium chelatase family protein